MIFAKSALLVSFLALSNVVVASGPSACLLSAVGYVQFGSWKSQEREVVH